VSQLNPAHKFTLYVSKINFVMNLLSVYQLVLFPNLFDFIFTCWVNRFLELPICTVRFYTVLTLYRINTIHQSQIFLRTFFIVLFYFSYLPSLRLISAMKLNIHITQALYRGWV
jgi:hypothetical protein